MVLGHSKKLRSIFIKYVLTLGILVIFLFASNFYLGPIPLLQVYQANYSEKVIEKNIEQLKTVPKVSMELLTSLCSFGVYSDNGDYLYGSFSGRDIEQVWKSYLEGANVVGIDKHITAIKRSEGILIISYPLTMQYRSPAARAVLPNPELTMILLFFLELVILIILWSSSLSKKISSELNYLTLAAEKIENQNLDFNVGKSKIQEIDRVLQGINNMKDALKHSLEKQWTAEKQRQEQISSLAHDVKTPLTIVKGNIELLNETELTKEQRAYCDYIYESSRQMEGYIQDLLAVSKHEAINDDKSELKAFDFLNALREQASVLSLTKHIELLWESTVSKEALLFGNEAELMRGLMNIVLNAVDFSPENSSIAIISKACGEQLRVTIKDSGTGFTDKMLKYGKQQLSMGDESRTQSGHHGLGLYIADTIISKHQGELILANHSDGGGVVTVMLPLM